MKYLKFLLLVLNAGFVFAAGNANLIIFYEKSADEWVEAIPIGNGRIGAMIYGRPENELIQFNEDTFWTKGPYDPVNPQAFAALPKARELVFDGRTREAQELIDQKMMGIPSSQAEYQPAGLLNLIFQGHSNPVEYHRQLDLNTAVATIEYKTGDIKYKRQIFCSWADQVTVIYLSADKKDSINFTATFNAVENNKKIEGQASDALELTVYPKDNGVLRCCSKLKIIGEKGKVSLENNKLIVKNANSAILLLASATNYVNYNDFSGNPEEIVKKHIASASKKSFQKLLSDHIKSYQKLFNRVWFDLPEGRDSNLPTDVRIKNFAQNDDVQLAALYFQFGRYLLISCSRPGGQPANLQGLWNNDMNPPWSSKWTININTEMNYWPAESTNLSECHQPLFDLIKDISETGQRTAKINYGASGWVCHHNTDIWRATAPIDSAFYGFWPSGGAWLCQHLWYHYEYTGDKVFLKKIYPIMKGAAQFFVDTLVEEPLHHWLVTCPSMSPENARFDKVSICAGPTMDTEIIRDLFNHCIVSSQILGIDEDFRNILMREVSNLAPMQIGSGGQLQEWLDDNDFDTPEKEHRHVSHLYALFPSGQINKNTPDLFAAARKSLELRGDGGTGWSKAWKINLWARLQDGNHAYKMLASLISTGTYANMFDAHPPFQIDGNFGGTSGICEMLMQSYSNIEDRKLSGEILLLPALPKAWPNGSIKGLCGRGGFEINIKWENGRLEKAEIKSLIGSRLKIFYKEKSVEIKTVKGKIYRFDENLKSI